MPNFIETSHCKTRAHCVNCVTDPAWREKMGAPAVCPFGITKENVHEREMPQRMPATGTLVTNVVKAAANEAKAIVNQVPKVEAEEAERRLNICKGCEFFVDDKRCLKCGCFMKAKVHLRSATCPEKKW